MELRERLAQIAADSVVAAADVHTGAMIALVPRDVDALALGNEPSDNIHITLAYLGQADELDDERRARILETAEAISTKVPLKAKVSGTAYLKDGKCTVMLVDSRELRDVQEMVEDTIGAKSSWPGYLPHITLDYGDKPLDVNGSLPDEIEFGALRVAFGGENHDFDGLVVASALTADLKGIVRKAKSLWDEALHPRAKNGRFIEKGGFVKGVMTFLDADGKPEVKRTAAKVTDIDDKGNIFVVDKNGRKGIASARTIEEATTPKAYVPSVLDKPRRPPETPEQRRERQLKSMADAASKLTNDPVERMKVLDGIMGNLRGSPIATDYQHNKRGKSRDEWSDERMAKHEEMWDILMDRIDSVGVPRERESLVLGGQPGAGKSFSLLPGEAAGDLGVVGWDLLGDPPEGVTHVVMNPDVIKDVMVEMDMIPEDLPSEIRPREAASVIHAESNFLTKLFMSRLAAMDVNVVYDSTMANTSHVEKNIRALAEAGYTFSGLYVKIPKEESRLSTKRRFIQESLDNPELGGRFVPTAASSAWDTEGTFKRFRSWFTDGWMMVDNTGISKGEPRKNLYDYGAGDGSGLIFFLAPPGPKPPKRKQGNPKTPEFWTSQGSLPFEQPGDGSKPKPVMWKPGMKLSDDVPDVPSAPKPKDDYGLSAVKALTDGELEDEIARLEKLAFRSMSDESKLKMYTRERASRSTTAAAGETVGFDGYVTDTQAALGLYAGVLDPDQLLELLRADAVLVSPEVGEDPEDYLGAPTLHHEINRLGRGGLAEEISVEVDRLRLAGLVHDS